MRKAESNRNNALHSTGPKTLIGKLRSAQNSTKHGLTSRASILPHERMDEFKAFSSEMLLILKPSNALMNFLAERIISLAWRLRRIPKIESGAILEMLRTTIAERHREAKDPMPFSTLPSDDDIEGSEAHVQAVTTALKPECDDGHAIAIAESQSNIFSNLARYETSIQRNLMSLLEQYRLLTGEEEGAATVCGSAIQQDLGSF